MITITKVNKTMNVYDISLRLDACRLINKCIYVGLASKQLTPLINNRCHKNIINFEPKPFSQKNFFNFQPIGDPQEQLQWN